jgi:quercetin dioxygenase-like cupin family protein
VEFAAGDILLCPMNRPHWHGATPESSMTHIAVQESLNGTNIIWMQQVTDEEYRAGPA